MNEFGIDIAFQNAVTPVMAQELDFAIFRIGTLGYGSTGTTAYYDKKISIDSAFYNNIRTMEAANKKWGCYIFSYAFDARSAMHEADEVLRILNELDLHPSLPIFFDWEYDSYNRVVAAGVALNPLLMLNLNLYFMARIVSRSNFRAGWYANLDFQNNYFYSQYGVSGADAARNLMNQGYLYWIASWGDIPPQNPVGDCWQYAGDVMWNGIDADLNRVTSDRFFNGSVGRKLPLWLMAYIINKNRKKGGVTFIS